MREEFITQVTEQIILALVVELMVPMDTQQITTRVSPTMEAKELEWPEVMAGQTVQQELQAVLAMAAMQVMHTDLGSPEVVAVFMVVVHQELEWPEVVVPVMWEEFP